MFYNVNKNTGNLIPVAGATLYADLPIGSWVKNDMSSIPTGFLKYGDTISPTEYPELYAKYGSTVPYKADTSELSDYENASNSFTAQYDGFINVYSAGATGNSINIVINGTVIVGNSNATFGVNGVSAVFKKGDTVSVTGDNVSSATKKVAYYKKSLIVKAKNVGAPTDIIDGVRDVLGSYSTTETVVGTWVDGKPIYRKAWTNLNIGTTEVNVGTISDIDFPIDINAIISQYTTTSATTLSYVKPYVKSQAEIQIRSKNIYCKSGSGFDRVNTIIIEYTKTTD